jgi:hypothetical protein
VVDAFQLVHINFRLLYKLLSKCQKITTKGSGLLLHIKQTLAPVKQDGNSIHKCAKGKCKCVTCGLKFV